MDPENLELAITSRTKGIVPVHLFGHTADMDPILAVSEKYGLWVVEDSCQAHLAEYKGRKAGSIGIAGAFSFYPAKNMGACGEAGAVTTNEAELAAKVHMLRDHGQKHRYCHEMEGYNGRCDALQAAALRIKLKYLPAWNEARRKNADFYLRELESVAGIGLPKVSEDCLAVFHQFVVQLDNRDQIAAVLREEGISTGCHYPIPLHFQQAYAPMELSPGSFPVAERCAERFLSLPMFPELTTEQIVYVSERLKVAVEKVARQQ